MASDFTLARLNMVESQIRTADVTDLPLQDVLRVAPREAVVPADKAHLAYADAEVEYAPGRWLLRPRDIGKLLQALRPREGERALAIAAPYAAQVLEGMGLSVERLDGADYRDDVLRLLFICCHPDLPATPQPGRPRRSWRASNRRPGRPG